MQRDGLCPVRKGLRTGFVRFPPLWRVLGHHGRDMSGTRLEKIREMLTQNPTDSFLLYGLANEYKNAGDLTQAIAGYRHLMSVNPDYVAAYYHCGQTLEAAGDAEAAAATYDAGIEVARRIGDMHALSELRGVRDLLD